MCPTLNVKQRDGESSSLCTAALTRICIPDTQLLLSVSHTAAGVSHCSSSDQSQVFFFLRMKEKSKQRADLPPKLQFVVKKTESAGEPVGLLSNDLNMPDVAAGCVLLSQSHSDYNSS